MHFTHFTIVLHSVFCCDPIMIPDMIILYKMIITKIDYTIKIVRDEIMVSKV